MFTLPDLERSRQKFHDTRCVLARHLTTATLAAKLLDESAPWPAKRVRCGIPGVEWTEQQVPDQSRLAQLFSHPELIAFLTDIATTQTRHPKAITCWVSRYSPGEYINAHVDRAGSIQVVLALKTAGEKNGGELSVHYGGYSDSFLLGPGDGLLFEATTVLHCTAPIAQAAPGTRPERVTAVARYFF